MTRDCMEINRLHQAIYVVWLPRFKEVSNQQQEAIAQFRFDYRAQSEDGDGDDSSNVAFEHVTEIAGLRHLRRAENLLQSIA